MSTGLLKVTFVAFSYAYFVYMYQDCCLYCAFESVRYKVDAFGRTYVIHYTSISFICDYEHDAHEKKHNRLDVSFMRRISFLFMHYFRLVDGMGDHFIHSFISIAINFANYFKCSQQIQMK